MIFGSLTTAVTGLQAQTKALGNISDNIANVSTIGYKRVDTAFNDLVLNSVQPSRNPGGVTARPDYANDVQGTSQQVSNPTNLQIMGNGFFTVTRPVTKAAAGQTTTTSTADLFYTRDGSFSLNADRVLVNDSGFALNGYARNPTSGTFSTSVSPIQVTSSVDAPVATKTITLAANLPNQPSTTQAISPTPVQIYDAAGNPQQLTLNWRPGQAPNDWRLTIDAPGAVNSKPLDGTLAGFPTSATATTTVAPTRARAQTDSVTFQGPGIKLGDTYKVVINGKAFTTQITAANSVSVLDLTGVAQTLADQINGAVPPPGVLAGVVNGSLQLTASTPGTAFTTSASVVDGTPTTNAVQGPFTTAPTATVGEIQRYSFTNNAIDLGDVFAVDLNSDGTDDATVTVTAANIGGLRTLGGVTTALASQINAAGLFATATANGSDLTLTGLVANQTLLAANGAAPTVTVTNGSTVTNSASDTTVISNIPGKNQTDKVTLTGVPGDVGAVYSVRVQSPSPIVPAAADFVLTTPPAAAVPTAVPPTPAVAEVRDVSFGPTATATQAGEQYSLTISGSTYSLLITQANQAQFADRDAVVQQLATQINNDPAGPATATIPTPGVTTDLQFTARQTNVAMNVTQPSVPNFDQTLTYTTTGKETSLDEIANQLAIKVTASGLPVTATAANGVLTLTSNSDSTTFLTTPASADGQTPAFIGFNFAGTLGDGTKAGAGTLSAIDLSKVGTGNATAPALHDSGDPADVTFQVDYGNGPQTVTLNLGTFNSTTGLTQFQGNDINVTSLLQDGSPQGTFKDIEITTTGDVVANYDNGRRTVLARIPLALFSDPDGLTRETGNAFSESAESGTASLSDIGFGGAGALETSSLEGSNVDIASEFTKMIVAQRAYTANTKVVTTTDEMTTDALNMKR
jgi:flagellar hook protein FlgE